MHQIFLFFFFFTKLLKIRSKKLIKNKLEVQILCECTFLPIKKIYVNAKNQKNKKIQIAETKYFKSSKHQKK